MTPTTTVPGAPGRYGAAPSRGARVAVIVVVGLVAAVLVAALVSIALRASNPAVTSGVTGFRVVDDHHVEVRFEVHKAPLAEAVCTVRARGADGAEVGTADVTVGPRRDGLRVTRLTYLLTTTARPVSGEVPGCRIIRTR